MRAKRSASLTVREAEVLTWVAQGASHAQIAARLGTSPATVGKHVEHAYDRLGVHSRAEAAWLMGCDAERIEGREPPAT